MKNTPALLFASDAEFNCTENQLYSRVKRKLLHTVTYITVFFSLASRTHMHMQKGNHVCFGLKCMKLKKFEGWCYLLYQVKVLTNQFL